MEKEYKYKQIYNTKSNRLHDYDYGSNGCYFITICTKDRQNYFGEIIDGNIILNDFGMIVLNEIKNIEILRENVLLDEFCIMLNHIHLILFIDNSCRDVSLKHLENKQDVSVKHIYEGNNKQDIFGNKQDVSAKRLYGEKKNNYYSNISPKKGTIGNIIKLFKSYISKSINSSQSITYFAWQPNYYDRIIRNDDELNKIRIYIQNNPLKWEIDKNNSENIFM